jgi:CRP-like cAMP-binding protein
MARARRAASVKRARIDPYVATLLGKITVDKQELSFRKGEKIFSQGDRADSIYFIQTGRIKITVVSAEGKEAVLAMPGPHEFFGEGSLVNQSLRISTAEALEPSTVFRVEKRVMFRSLHEQPELSEKLSLIVDPQPRPRRRSLRSAFQSQRETAGPCSPEACTITRT